MRKIRISFPLFSLEAQLLDNKTADKIYSTLPITSSSKLWGDEIYFSIPFHMEKDESAKEVVEKGELGFWPEGNAFCIFFGKTPASKEGEIRPASAVNIFGKVLSPLDGLKEVNQGDKVKVEII